MISFNHALNRQQTVATVLDPVVQSIVNELVSGQNVTVIVSTLSNLQVFLLKKCATHIFSKSIRVYAIFESDTFTNDIVNFKQLGPVHECGT